jgi:hypothetical protein
MSYYGGWPGQPGQPGQGQWVYTPPAPKPGVIPLHPLALSDVMGGIFGSIRHYFRQLYGPLAVLLLASALITGTAVAFSYAPLHHLYDDIRNQGDITHGQAAEIVLILGAIGLLYAVLMFCWYTVSGLISSAVLRHAVIGRRVTVRQILDEARPRLWKSVGGFALLLLAYAGPMLVAVVVTGALGALGGDAAAGFGFLLVLPAMGWMVFLSGRMALMAPVIVLENAGPKTAFARAWRLNQGNWWRTAGFTFLASLIGSFAAQVVNTPISLMTGGGVFNTFPQQGQVWTVDNLPSFHSFWVYLIGFLISIYVSGILLMPLVGLCNGLLYVDRRIRRESLDEQLAAEAGVSLTPPPPAPPQAYGGWPGQPPYGPQPPYAQPPYQQPPYPPYGAPPPGQQPYGGWPGQQPQPGWPSGPQPPSAPPVPPPPSDSSTSA